MAKIKGWDLVKTHDDISEIQADLRQIQKSKAKAKLHPTSQALIEANSDSKPKAVLQQVLDQAQTARMTLAIEHNQDLEKTLSDWAKQTLAPEAVIEVKQDPDLLMGLQIEWQGKFFDGSWQGRFE